MTDTLTIVRPDDWHLHLRDGDALADVVGDTARQFGRAIIMPNLKPPVTTTAQARAYRERILAALPAGTQFEPLMTLYLTDNTSPEVIREARASGFIHGVNRTLGRTGIGVYEMVTAPFPPYHPVCTDTFAPGPVYPDNYTPGVMADSMFSTDTELGYSGGDVLPFVPGSRFRVFDMH